MNKEILKKPIITEKANSLISNGHYMFVVDKDANKKQIKEKIEKDYKVKVICVKIINVKSKKRRLGRIEGTKRGYKKAIIKIQKGQKIEVFPS